MIFRKTRLCLPCLLALFVVVAVESAAANAQPEPLGTDGKTAGAIVAATEPAPADQKFLSGPATDMFAPKSRVFVLTDIGNEPDDQMSFVRLLVYANEIDIEGVAAVTSTWLKTKPNPAPLHEIINAYAKVLPNLKKNASDWPTAKKLHAAVTMGPQAYGLAAANTLTPSSATTALIAATNRADARPLWVSIWGGANVLAEA